MAIEIVGFPINSMVMFHSYVKLPEGNLHITKFGVFKVLTTKHPTDVDAVSNRIAPLSFSVCTHTHIYILYTMWYPQVISWFISPSTIDISTIDINQLSYLWGTTMYIYIYSSTAPM